VGAAAGAALEPLALGAANDDADADAATCAGALGCVVLRGPMGAPAAAAEVGADGAVALAANVEAFEGAAVLCELGWLAFPAGAADCAEAGDDAALPWTVH
jgi:hypothetical protein